MTAATGTLEQTADGWALRFVRHLRHDPETVWAALTERDQRRAWFPDTVEGEFVAGATLRFSTGHASIPDFSGTVLRAEAPRLLEFTWGEDTLRFEIEPTDGGCTLTLRDAIAELGKGARDGAGWHVCLDQFEAALEGRPTGWAPGDRWAEVHQTYVGAFGAAAATIGPPEGV